MCYFSAGTLEPFRLEEFEFVGMRKRKKNKYSNLWLDLAVAEMNDWEESWLDITQFKKLK